MIDMLDYNGDGKINTTDYKIFIYNNDRYVRL